jgi:two-component system, OmpR family, response regulator
MQKRPRILIVDDETNIRRSLLVRLENSGYLVDAAENAAGAIAMYHAAIHAQEAYDLILLDIIMPGPNGLEVLDVIRREESSRGISKEARTPVVIMTAMTDSWEQDPRYDGCDDYIQKPFKTDTLMETIRKKVRKP